MGEENRKIEPTEAAPDTGQAVPEEERLTEGTAAAETAAASDTGGENTVPAEEAGRERPAEEAGTESPDGKEAGTDDAGEGTGDSGEDDIGYIEVADEVIAIVASLAALDVPGVLEMSTGFREGINNFLGKKSPAKGVRVAVTGKSCRISVYVTVEYGCNIPEVAMKLQKKVKRAVEDMTEYDAEFVDVHIEGVKRRRKSNLEISFAKEKDDSGEERSIFDKE